MRSYFKSRIKDFGTSLDPASPPASDPEPIPLTIWVCGILLVVVYPWIQLFQIFKPGWTPLVLLWVWFISTGSIPYVFFLIATASASELLTGWAWLKNLGISLLALVVGLNGFVAAFAQTYYVLCGGAGGGFSPGLTPMRAAFYTWGTLTTVGSGIVAKSPGAQLLTILQMAVDIFMAFGIFALIANVLRYPMKSAMEAAEKKAKTDDDTVSERQESPTFDWPEQ